jgi:imidazolonepropionase-like amidohydrolase
MMLKKALSLSSVLAGLAVFASALFAFPSAKARAIPQAQTEITRIALVGEKIYVSPFAKPIDDGAILIRDGKIAAVGRHGKIRIPEATGTLDCTGMVVTAGFQNSHVHFTEPKWADAAQLPAALLSQQLQQMLTRHGFTTVVDLASNIANTVALRQRINSGEVTGPRILTAGIPLYPPDGIPYYVKAAIPPDELKLLYTPATPADAVADVDRDLAGGADVVKLFTASWVSNTRVVAMPLAVAQAAAAEAHKHGKLVFAHPSNVAGFLIALQAHVDVLAHAVEETRGWNVSYISQMQAAHMWLIPTLSLFTGDSNYPNILAQVRDFSQAQGKIIFGTDVGFRSDYDPTPEYVEMARAGMTFPQILDSLTTAPALRFGESKIRGQIQPGMDADVVVLAADPADDIRNLARVNYTFREGQVIFSIANQ